MAVNEALCTLLDHVYQVWEQPNKYKVWADFFPSILVNERESRGNNEERIRFANSKCSRYHKRERRLLRKELETNALKALEESGVEPPDVIPGVDEEFYKVTWYVRWLVRSPGSHSRERLWNPAGQEDAFTDSFFKTFTACLGEDFNASENELEEFENLVKELYHKGDDRENKADFTWSEHLDENFFETARKRISFNYYADVYAMLFLAALYGPMNYRWEFRYLNVELMKRGTLRPISTFSKSAKRNGVLKTYAMLTRVTYDETSVDERDYITCAETISLKGITEVWIGRSVPSRVFGDTAYVSLQDEQLSDLRQAEVSKRHACLARSNGGWVLRDWKSTSGTLVVTRSGDRFVVGGTSGKVREQKLANGDILCFAHSKERAVADMPCYLFHLCAVTRDV